MQLIRSGVRGAFGRYVALTAALVFAIVAALVIVLTNFYARSNVLQELAPKLDAEIRAQGDKLLGDVAELKRDVLFLSNTPPVQGIIRADAHNGFDELGATTLDGWKLRLQTTFVAYAKTHASIMQVRFIGIADAGRELVRVDRNGDEVAVIPEDRLQAKGDRDYFQATIQRPLGQIYVSDINLNRERGAVEVPHRPTLRVATPVYGPDGKLFGIVIINRDFGSRLTRFAQSPSGDVKNFLLNASGDFLANADNELNFGFDLGQRNRWDDRYTATKSGRQPEGAPAVLHSYYGPNGLVHAVQQRLSLDEEEPQRDLTAIAMISDQWVQARVAGARSYVIKLLAGLAALATFFLYLIVLSVRRRDELSAAQSEMAAIVSSSTDAIIGMNLDGVVTSWNKAATRMFGYSAERAIGHHVVELLVPPDRKHEETRILSEVAAGQVVMPFDTVRRRQDGSQLHVSITVSPVLGPDGEIVGAAKISRDITEQKAAEASIRELNENLERQVEDRTRQLQASVALQRAIVEGAGYAVIATNTEGLITVFNPSAELMLGYREDEMVGKLTPAAFHDPDEVVARADELSAELKRPVAPGFEVFVIKARSGNADENEWTYIRKDGSRLPVLLKVSALRGVNGEIEGFLGIAIDLTERKRRQAELIEAKAAADAASKAKGDFLANMSHEIRTPMNAVLGMLQLLHRTDLTERQVNYIGKAESAARMLLDIINDILDFSKIEAGKLTLDLQPFVVDEMFRDVGVIIGASVGNKDVEVLFQVDPFLPPSIVGDSVRLKQILINLAGNAVKFTEHGEVVLALRVLREDWKELVLEISVRDTGIGMSAEQQQRLFTAFSQAEAGTSRRYGGTGLGLVISQRLIALMGGELRVRSEHGKGSTFTFTITVTRAPSGTVQGGDAEALQQQRAGLHGLRVLVVDDNEDARRIISELLGSLGWKAEAAASGEAALALLERNVQQGASYDVAFIDWMMPGMDGWQTAERIRRLGKQGELPLVVMVTAHTREMLARRSEGSETLIDGILVKPVTASDLYDVVADALQRDGQPSKRRKDAAATPARLTGMHILLVEDNETNQLVASELLGHEGAVVDVADSGQAALDAIAQARRPFDVVLMDIQMPGMDGYTATRKIREDLGQRDLQIIAMTANAMASDREACLAAGMNEHVGKPFHIDQLVATLLKQCGRSVETAAASAATPAAGLPSPDGYAFQDALERMGNNRSLYARQVRGFAAAHGADIERLRKLLEAGNRSEAARELHTLRGVSATLGAQALAHQLAEVERLAKADGPMRLVRQQLDLAEPLLREAIKTLERLAVSLEPAAANVDRKIPATLDTEKLESLMAELDGLLEDHNMRAMDVWSELNDLLAAMTLKSAQALDQAMHRLDFHAALQLLSELKKELE